MHILKLYLWYNAKKVNKVFMIGSESITKGASLQSYNEFASLHSGVNSLFLAKHLCLAGIRSLPALCEAHYK